MSFIGKSLQVKQIIAEYLISSSLQLSHYLIPTDKDYSIHMWIRILEDNQITEESTILEIQNQSGQKTKLISFQLTNIKIKNEFNEEIVMDWPVPYEPGLADIEYKATIYNKWLPFIISNSQNGVLNLFSYPNLNMLFYNSIKYNQSSKSVILFQPKNINSIKVIFSNIIFRNFFIDQAQNLSNYIYNNDYLGIYYYAAFSKNQKIFYNLNQGNEYKNSHIYYKHLMVGVYDYQGYYGTHEIHMPNFHDSNVYYICQFYQEMDFLFQDNFADINLNIPYIFSLYERQLIYQNKNFKLQYQFEFSFTNIDDYDILETCKFDNDGQIQTSITGTLRLIDQLRNFTTNRAFLINIYNYPQSNFDRMNEIQFHFLWIEFNHNVSYNVDYIYSYYDQITQTSQDTNIMAYFIGVKIYKMIFYRDIYNQRQQELDYFIFTLGQSKNVYLKKISPNQIFRYINFNPNSMTQIIQYEPMEDPGHSNLCKDVVSNCVFCLNFKCIQCNWNYILVDEVCIFCRTTHFQFLNSCQYQTSLYFQETVQNSIQYDPLQFVIYAVKLDFTGLRDPTFIINIERKVILQSYQQQQKFQSQIQDFYTTNILRISSFKGYFIQEFDPQTQGICKNTKYFRLQKNFIITCVDQCQEGEHLQQEIMCVENFQGCQIQNSQGCQQCLPSYDQVTEVNGKIVCHPRQVLPQQVFDHNYQQLSANVISNCQIANTNLQCIYCDAGNVLNTQNNQCFVASAEFQKIATNSSCTKYDNIDSPINCIGKTGNQYIDNTSNYKWLESCNSPDYYMYTCNDCASNDYYLNSFKNCQKCNFQYIITGPCKSCDAGYQIVNEECVQSICLDLVSNCLECNTNNMTQCNACIDGYYLVKNEDFFECIIIQNCNTLDYTNQILSCTVCAAGYILVDKDLQQNTKGVLCISNSNYLQNCANYEIESTELKCKQCKNFYVLIYQYFCLHEQYIVENCIDYDLSNNLCLNCISAEFACLDQDLNLVSQNCKYCIESWLIKDNCLQINTQYECKKCSLNYTCIDSAYILSQNDCEYCKLDSTVTQQCYQYDASFSCQSCINNYTCVDINYAVSQNQCAYCMDSILLIPNCYQFNQNLNCLSCQQNFQCIDSNFYSSGSLCQYCIDFTLLTENCYRFDSDFACIECNANHKCIDQDHYLSKNNCMYCVDASIAIDNCQLFDSNFQCLLCILDFTCLDQVYTVVDTLCSQCQQTSLLIQNCVQFNSDLLCNQCDTGYFSVDQIYTPCVDSCSHCFFNENKIRMCLQYDANQLCVSCETSYFCLDSQYNVSQIVCKYCIDDIYKIDYCETYNQSYECTQCQQNYFMSQNKQLQNLCIHDDLFIEDCVQYFLADNNYYECILCIYDFLPQQNECIICSSKEIYFVTQQICIYKDNFVDNCQYYNILQECQICEEGYYLVNVQQTISQNEYQDQQIMKQCVLNYIEFCKVYKQDDFLCIQCLQNYNLSYDLKQCLNEQSCSYQNCIQLDQQQFLYSTIQDNCLVYIDNCQRCQQTDKNICTQCKDKYNLQNQKCILDCQSEEHQYLSQKHKFCQIQTEVTTIQQICKVVFSQCKKCNLNQNTLNCVQCDDQYILQNNLCIFNNQLYKNNICSFACLKCNKQNQCLQCMQGFMVQNYICIQQKNIMNDIKCQKEVICYVQKQNINSHCSQCMQKCNMHIENNIITYDEQILFNADFKLHNSIYFTELNAQKNHIRLEVKNNFQDATIIINSSHHIKQSYNCQVKEEYVFYIKKQNYNNANQILRSIEQSSQYAPYMTPVLGPYITIGTQFLVEELKLFWYINLLGYGKGDMYMQFLTKKKQNMETLDMTLNFSFTSQKDLFKFIIYRDFMDLNFVKTFVNYLIQQILSYILQFCFCTLILIMFFEKKIYKEYLDKLQQIFIQYLLIIITKTQLDFSIYSSQMYHCVELKFKQKTIFLIIIFSTFYVVFWTAHYIQKKYKKILQLQRASKRQQKIEKMLQNICNMIFLKKMLFLFIKLQVLFVFQNNIFLSSTLFILVTIFEMNPLEIYKQYRFLKKVYYMDLIERVLQLFFFVLLILHQTSILSFQSYVYDSVFVILIMMYFINPVFIRIVFMLKKSLNKQVTI